MSTDTMIVLSNLALVMVTILLAFVTVEAMIKDDKHDTMILKIVRMFTHNDDVDNADTDESGKHDADHYGRHAA